MRARTYSHTYFGEGPEAGLQLCEGNLHRGGTQKIG